MKLSALVDDRYLPHARRTLKPRTVAEYDRLLRVLILPVLGTRQIEKLSLEDVEELHSKRSNTPVQANRALAVLSAVLQYAAGRHLIPANPCRGAHRNREQAKERFLTADEGARLLAVLETGTDPCTILVQLLLLTGARPGELLSARWEWLQGSVLRLPDAKTGARPVYLSPAALRAVARLSASLSGPIFPPLDLRRGWARISAAAGISGVRLYDLRHTFASAALGAGVSLDIVGRLLGHRKAQTTLRYAHLAPEAALDAATRATERLGNYNRRPSEQPKAEIT